jgi:hypothetical protein
MKPDDDCGKLVLNICGKTRVMIIRKQYEIMTQKKYKPSLARVIEILLEECANSQAPPQDPPEQRT